MRMSLSLFCLTTVVSLSLLNLIPCNGASISLSRVHQLTQQDQLLVPNINIDKNKIDGINMSLMQIAQNQQCDPMPFWKLGNVALSTRTIAHDVENICHLPENENRPEFKILNQLMDKFIDKLVTYLPIDGAAWLGKYDGGVALGLESSDNDAIQTMQASCFNLPLDPSHKYLMSGINVQLTDFGQKLIDKLSGALSKHNEKMEKKEESQPHSKQRKALKKPKKVSTHKLNAVSYCVSMSLCDGSIGLSFPPYLLSPIFDAAELPEVSAVLDQFDDFAVALSLESQLSVAVPYLLYPEGFRDVRVSATASVLVSVTTNVPFLNTLASKLVGVAMHGTWLINFDPNQDGNPFENVGSLLLLPPASTFNQLVHYIEDATLRSIDFGIASTNDVDFTLKLHSLTLGLLPDLPLGRTVSMMFGLNIDATKSSFRNGFRYSFTVDISIIEDVLQKIREVCDVIKQDCKIPQFPTSFSMGAYIENFDKWKISIHDIFFIEMDGSDLRFCAIGHCVSAPIWACNKPALPRGSHGIGGHSTCSEDTLKEGAICYDFCPLGYYGVASTCYSSCPSEFPHDIGLLCCKSAAHCSPVSLEQCRVQPPYTPLPASSAGRDTMTEGQILRTGESLVAKHGSEEVAMLFLQPDGNLVIYALWEGRRQARWATYTSGGQNFLKLQDDCNLVLYSREGNALWNSRTDGKGEGCYLILQGDRNLVIYNDNAAAIFNTDTGDNAVSTLVTSSPMPQNGRHVLELGQIMGPSDYLNSPNNKYALQVQRDGNVVLYKESRSHPIFQTRTEGHRSAVLKLESGCNLAVYDVMSHVVWSSNTREMYCYLVLQDDGNLVLYNENADPRWYTGTNDGSSSDFTPTRAPVPHGSSPVLSSGSVLHAGSALTSSSGSATLYVQTDGNVVLYAPDRSHFKWQTNTLGHKDVSLSMQLDCNLVLYEQDRAIWDSGTSGRGVGCYLIVQDDINLVVYNDNANAVWWSGTNEGGHADFHPTTSPLPSGPQAMREGSLYVGKALRSENGRYALVVQADGNVVVYKDNRQNPQWSTGTNANGRTVRMSMQADCNLVVYDQVSGRPLWEAHTYHRGQGCFVVMQNDGNLVIYDNNYHYLWSLGHYDGTQNAPLYSPGIE